MIKSTWNYTQIYLNLFLKLEWPLWAMQQWNTTTLIVLLLIGLSGDKLHGSFSRIKATLTGQFVKKTLSGWEFGWGGTSVKW